MVLARLTNIPIFLLIVLAFGVIVAGIGVILNFGGLTIFFVSYTSTIVSIFAFFPFGVHVLYLFLQLITFYFWYYSFKLVWYFCFELVTPLLTRS